MLLSVALRYTPNQAFSYGWSTAKGLDSFETGIRFGLGEAEAKPNPHLNTAPNCIDSNCIDSNSPDGLRMTYLTIGDPVPWFTCASTSSPNYHFDTVGGYRVVLSFIGSTKHDASRQVIQDFWAVQSEFEQLQVPFFGVIVDPADQMLSEQITTPTYCKLIWDFEQRVSQTYGVCKPLSATDPRLEFAPVTLILNENLRVVHVLSFTDPSTHVAQVMQAVRAMPTFEVGAIATRQAPILMIPDVFDRAFCQMLIQQYEADGGSDSGFMRQIDGKTVAILDHGFKKRKDFLIQDPLLLQSINQLILQRVKPEIEKAFQFTITRFERHLVACYEATNQGFFNRHRDNTTKGTAHRRFAMSLNLNAEEYEGGYLRFPEYGSHLYRPNSGEAIIFSCSLLHEATPVTAGRRYVLLSFFYNDEDARVREQNQRYIVTEPQAPVG